MRWGRVVAGVGALAAIAVLAVVFRDGIPDGIPDVRETVRVAGVWAPMLFVLLHGVVTAVPIPRTLFTVAAGVLFGSVAGVLLAIVGTCLAAAVAFLLVRLLGGRVVERYGQHPRMAWVRGRLRRNGLVAMVSLRLIPPIPFWAMNYATALAGARFGPYLLATMLGILPGTVTIVVLGDAAVGGNPHPAMLAVSVVSGLIGLVGAVLVARRGAPPVAQQEPEAEQPV